MSYLEQQVASDIVWSAGSAHVCTCIPYAVHPLGQTAGLNVR